MLGALGALGALLPCAPSAPAPAQPARHLCGAWVREPELEVGGGRREPVLKADSSWKARSVLYPQNHVGRGWGIRNGTVGTVRLPKILVLTIDDFVSAQRTAGADQRLDAKFGGPSKPSSPV